MVSFFPNEACLLSLSINVFIETLAKWRYWNGHYIVLVVVIASEWMNMLCVYMSAILRSCFFFPFFFSFLFFSPLLDWTMYSFPGSKALKLHHCNGPAFMQLRRPFKRARWYSEVCACVCVYTIDGYCLCLRSILSRGMDIQW